MPQLRTDTAPSKIHTHTHTHTHTHAQVSTEKQAVKQSMIDCFSIHNFSNIEKILQEKNLKTKNTPSVELNFPSQLKNDCHHLTITMKQLSPNHRSTV